MQVDRVTTGLVEELLATEGGRIMLMEALGDIFPQIDLVALQQQPHLWNLVRRILITPQRPQPTQGPRSE